MSEIHRKRKRQFMLRLLDEELALLSAKADEAGMTKTEYIRNMIYFGAAHERTVFTRKQTESLRYEINRIGNNVNQIAFKVNATRSFEKKEFEGLYDNYAELLSTYDRFIRGATHGDN